MTCSSLGPSEASPGPRGRRKQLKQRPSLPIAILWLLAPGLLSCQAGYVLRQGLGQFRLSNEQIPLDTITEEGSLSAEARAKLAWVPRVLEFAVDRLGLDPGQSLR